MKTILLITALLFLQTTQAQRWKEKLNQVKETARQKAEQRADQKVETGIDQGIEKADSVVSGKKKIFGKKSKNDGKVIVNEKGEMVIETNIDCEAGKSLVEETLLGEDAIETVSIDIETGKVCLACSSPPDGKLYYKSVEMIRKNGFTANGQKPTSKKKPCQ